MCAPSSNRSVGFTASGPLTRTSARKVRAAIRPDSPRVRADRPPRSGRWCQSGGGVSTRAARREFATIVTTVERPGHRVNLDLDHLTFLEEVPMRRSTMLVVALGFVMAFGTGVYAQTPSGTGDKMDKDKMMDKGKAMDKDKMMDKGKAMDKDKM